MYFFLSYTLLIYSLEVDLGNIIHYFSISLFDNPFLFFFPPPPFIIIFPEFRGLQFQRNFPTLGKK